MRFITDIPGAFRNGVLNASTAALRIGRWSTLVALWLLAIGCIALGLIAITSGHVLPGVAILLSAVTFTFVSITVIYTASASEWCAKSAEDAS